MIDARPHINDLVKLCAIASPQTQHWRGLKAGLRNSNCEPNAWQWWWRRQRPSLEASCHRLAGFVGSLAWQAVPVIGFGPCSVFLWDPGNHCFAAKETILMLHGRVCFRVIPSGGDTRCRRARCDQPLRALGALLGTCAVGEGT